MSNNVIEKRECYARDEKGNWVLVALSTWEAARDADDFKSLLIPDTIHQANQCFKLAQANPGVKLMLYERHNFSWRWTLSITDDFPIDEYRAAFCRSIAEG